MYKSLAASAAGIFASLIVVRALEASGNTTLDGRIGSGQYFVTYAAIVNVVIWGILFAITRGRGYLHIFGASGFATSIAVIATDFVAQYQTIPPVEEP